MADMEGVVPETPTVSLKEFIEGLNLSDDPDDVNLMMQAMQLNRIKVCVSIVAHVVLLLRLFSSEYPCARQHVEA